MVIKLVSWKKISLLTSLIIPVVINFEFNIAPTLTSNVCKDRGINVFLILAVLICLYQTPLHVNCCWGLLIHIIQSAPYICKYLFVLLWFTFWMDFCNSFIAPTKLLPLLDLIFRILPLLPKKLFNACKKICI